MDAVLQQSNADVVLFVDNDCVPLSRAADGSAAVGSPTEQLSRLAQATNHINKGVHVFAAPAFLAIARTAWMQLGKLLPPHSPRRCG